MFRKALLFQILFCSWSSTYAQVGDRLKVTAELGLPQRTTHENLSFFAQVEPKLEVADQLYLGMRMAVAINTQALIDHDSEQFLLDTEFDHGFFSVIPTLEYLWTGKKVEPYVGVGLGPYSIGNYVEVFGKKITDPSKEIFQMKVSPKLGFLIRSGLEWKMFRFGLEHNFVPQTELALSDGTKVGTVKSSYTGLTIGVRFLSFKK